MREELLTFLRADQLPDIIDTLIEAMGGSGITPQIVAMAASLLPPSEQQWRPLVVDLAVGTRKARALGKAHQGWLYTNVMTEQCTHPLIAEHHATRVGSHHSIVEICTGAGHDTLAMSKRCGYVETFEADDTVAAITTVNLERSDRTNVRVRNVRWSMELDCDPVPTAIWADPARRSMTGQRSRSLQHHEPSPLAILQWAERRYPEAVLGMKLGPADAIDELDDSSLASEFIGFGRECRERLVWKGVTIPPSSVTLVDHGISWSPKDGSSEFDHDLDSIHFLIEPHAAVIAAGFVDEYFRECGVVALDPHIAYGASDEPPEASAFHQGFSVVQIDQGVSEKRIRRRLEELQWGSGTEFKKRGWPGDPEDLRPLVSKGKESGVVIISRTETGHLTIYATRLEE